MADSEKNGTEIRLNKVMHQWVIITPKRGRRPRDFAASVKSDAAVPAHDPGCPSG